jgi:phage-related protein
MAISGGDGSIILKTFVDQSGLKSGLNSMKSSVAKIGKAFGAIAIGAGAAAIAVTKMATSAYADYEQLAGGVETLFKSSASKVMKYAEDAFRTTGMSANDYMKNVTSFSASLISSVGGDTEKAAEVANAAMISMSDNVNKFGSDQSAVLNAFQGFAKQQYMLLDNLKLGYGGTKTEMERLLKDAQAITGVKYDISNLADVYTAIGVIQEKLGVAGTTAIEAEKTISGSAASMKAAWQNVLSAIAGGGDLGRAIENLVDSLSKYMENIFPVIEKAIEGLGVFLERAIPPLVEVLARAIIKSLPKLINAARGLLVGLVKGVFQGFSDLMSGNQALEEQGGAIEENTQKQEDFNKELEQTIENQKKSLAGFDEIQTLSASTEEDSVSELQGIGGGEEFGVIIQPTLGNTAEVEAQLSEFAARIEPIFSPLSNLIKSIFSSDLFKSLIDALGQFKNWIDTKFVPTMNDSFGRATKSIQTAFDAIKEPLLDVWNNSIKPIFEDIGQWILDTINSTSQSFDYFGDKIDKYKPEIQAIIEAIGAVISLIWSVLKPVIESAIKGIWSKLQTTLDFIFSLVNAIGSAISFIKNLFLAIKALFQGNWDDALKYGKQALASFVNIFVGIANAIIAVLNNLWSHIFDGFKGIVNGIGGIISKIGSWFGADWNLHWDATVPLIPEIPNWVPKLATGAVIPPNKEFLAVLGDQKSGTNIEAPLQTIVDAFNIALAKNGGAGGGKTEVVLEVDGREFGRAVVEQGDRESRRVGTRLVIV